MKQLIVLLALLGVFVVGCGSEEPKVSESEEKAYRNPPKQMPSAASDAMQKGMAEAQKKKESQSQPQSK